MAKNSQKHVPIKDFIFEAPSVKRYNLHSGVFPAKSTKVSFQMPRKVKKDKEKDRKILEFRYNGAVYGKKNSQVTNRVPFLFFKKNSSISWINTPEPHENIEVIQHSPTDRPCPMHSFRTFRKERPQTSIASHRHQRNSESNLISNQKFDRKVVKKRKTEKLDVFIKSPSFIYVEKNISEKVPY